MTALFPIGQNFIRIASGYMPVDYGPYIWNGKKIVLKKGATTHAEIMV